MTGAYNAAERRDLETALRLKQPLHCPYCAVVLLLQTVPRPGEVSYVRRRVWVLCPVCRRTAGLDLKP